MVVIPSSHTSLLRINVEAMHILAPGAKDAGGLDLVATAVGPLYTMSPCGRYFRAAARITVDRTLLMTQPQAMSCIFKSRSEHCSRPQPL